MTPSPVAAEDKATEATLPLVRTRAPAGWLDMLPAAGRVRRPVPPWNEPFVMLDDARSTARPLLFSAPREMIVALSLDEVMPALARVRTGVRRGLHAAGYLAYEAGFAFERRLAGWSIGGGSPLIWFGLFGPPQAVDGSFDSAAGETAEVVLVPHADRRSYTDRVSRVLDLIEAGDCYQVNLTVETRVMAGSDPVASYRVIRRAQRSGWGGMLSTGKGGLLCCSPEMFFGVRGRTVWAKPMKGTIARGATPDEDRALIKALQGSEKNRAENLMIVDLLRNDLSGIAEPGSVQVRDLHAIETYPTLHQMTSSISATALPHVDVVDILARMFPCGSITGAPKIRAMEIIRQLEVRDRGAYTGSMGWVAPDGTAAFNVLIRTLEFAKGGDLRFGVGSAIVADSDPELEWRECCLKAQFLSAITKR